MASARLDTCSVRWIENLSKIWALFVKGKYQSKAALQTMLDDAATAYAKQSATQFVQDPTHTD